MVSDPRPTRASTFPAESPDLLCGVPRLEIPVRTSLCFVNGPVPVLSAWHNPESVVIEFEGREFGWVARKRFPHQAEDEPPPGPMVTCLVSDTEDDWERA